jgi:hypothetical protein
MVLPLARTRDETLLYLDLHPCDRCGSTGSEWESALVSVDGAPGRSYSGACAQCNAEREYRFRIPERPVPPTPGAPVTFGGPEPSQLLDAGEWLWVAELLADDVPPEPREAERALTTAAAAIDEILKFLPAGETTVPTTAFWSRRGRRVLAEDPGRFDEERLIVLRDAYLDAAGLAPRSER